MVNKGLSASARKEAEKALIFQHNGLSMRQPRASAKQIPTKMLQI
jgi:hypothetical protein